jgi:N6-L-threonylcarbamoyladenine synthase
VIKHYLLAIESSCDDTSIAISDTDYNIIFQATSSQMEHEVFGGVLPELASRLHIKHILRLTDYVLSKSDLSLEDISAIAVSINPGLIGSLLVGLSFAKGLAFSLNIPLIAVNHMLGHVHANYLCHKVIPPYLALIVSGGHTELHYFKTDTDFTLVGKTLDDSAGETFDKSAKLLNLGFPGGQIINKLAETGNPDFVTFPRGLPQKDNYNFSYSGLKTSIKQYLFSQTLEYKNEHLADITASIQSAIVEPLVKKTIRYAKLHNIKQILLAGGVAANTKLREDMQNSAKKINAEVFYPTPKLCTDNASMIAAAATAKFKAKQFSPLSINAFSDKGTRNI